MSHSMGNTTAGKRTITISKVAYFVTFLYRSTAQMTASTTARRFPPWPLWAWASASRAKYCKSPRPSYIWATWSLSRGREEGKRRRLSRNKVRKSPFPHLFGASFYIVLDYPAYLLGVDKGELLKKLTSRVIESK